MGLAVRIIPVLLHRGTNLVKGVKFNSWRTVGHVEQAASIHQLRGVDELCILDIGATPERRGPDLELISRITHKCFMPLTIGGGVRTKEDVQDVMNAGSDKVLICSASSIAIEEAASRLGSQAITAAIDYRGGCAEFSGTMAYVRCGTEYIRQNAVSLAKHYENDGAGEILLTSIDRDGIMCGYDLPTIEMVTNAVSIPVIANGGCGTPEHMLEAITAGASAVAASSMFLFTDTTPKSAALYLSQHNIEVRL